MITRFFIQAIVLATPVLSSAQTLWQKTAIGMSPKEVRSIVPEAIVPKNPSNLQGGAVELLRVEDVVVAQSHFTVHFYFTRERLDQVTLSMKVEKGDTFETCLPTFDSLVDALRAKYGAELSKKNEVQGGVRRAQALWIVGKTNIGILLLDVYGSALLNLNYQVRLSKDVEKL